MAKEFYLSRNKKILIGICADSFLVISSIFLAFSLRLGYWYFPTGNLIYATFFAPVLAIPVFASFGFYKNIIRFFGEKNLEKGLEIARETRSAINEVLG